MHSDLVTVELVKLLTNCHLAMSLNLAYGTRVFSTPAMTRQNLGSRYGID